VVEDTRASVGAAPVRGGAGADREGQRPPRVGERWGWAVDERWPGQCIGGEGEVNLLLLLFAAEGERRGSAAESF
jgi:hypothetical protein